MSQPRITVLDRRAKGTRKPPLPSLMPPVLHTLRQGIKPQLAELLQGLFDNSDDALFEMADHYQKSLEASVLQSGEQSPE